MKNSFFTFNSIKLIREFKNRKDVNKFQNVISPDDAEQMEVQLQQQQQDEEKEEHETEQEREQEKRQELEAAQVPIYHIHS